MSNFYRDAMNEPIDLGFTPTPITVADGEPPSPPPCSPGRPGAVAGRWLNPQQNSRLSRALPSGTWGVKWASDRSAGSGYGPVYLQQTRKRILLHDKNAWELFDAKGRHLADGQGLTEGSEVLLDADRGLFYFEPFLRGGFKGHRLSDGEEVFVTTIRGVGAFRRTFMATLPGRLLAVAGHYGMINPHGRTPEEAAMEVWSFGDPIRANGVKILLSDERKAVLSHHSTCFLVALGDAGFTIAVEDGVYRVDADLNFEAEFTGTFVPELLSLDEAGRIHLLVTEPDGLQYYWLLSAKGEQLVRLAVPEETHGSITVPPVVGYDHSVYLFTDTHVHAVGSKGRVEWTSDLGGPLGGAAISGDDRLLVAAGDSVSRFDIGGERETLVTLEGEELASAPILTEKGRLLVASRMRVFCMKAK
ncbi:MAG: hypothetical protein O7H41_15200 [Planctomycetota bacterium]|nr:hypothetical protein [Planctomycetota bacterium]